MRRLRPFLPVVVVFSLLLAPIPSVLSQDKEQGLQSPYPVEPIYPPDLTRPAIDPAGTRSSRAATRKPAPAMNGFLTQWVEHTPGAGQPQRLTLELAALRPSLVSMDDVRRESR